MPGPTERRVAIPYELHRVFPLLTEASSEVQAFALSRHVEVLERLNDAFWHCRPRLGHEVCNVLVQWLVIKVLLGGESQMSVLLLLCPHHNNQTAQMSSN